MAYRSPDSKREEKGMTIDSICNYIILVGTACFTIVKLVNLLAKPTSKYKKRQSEKEQRKFKALFDEILPDYLYQHDLEVRDRYKADREAYLKDIKNAILEDTTDILEEIKEINVRQNEDIHELHESVHKLNNSSRDVLRQKIMAIYHDNKKNKTLSIYAWEALQELYKDYKAQNGNSYIDKYYNRMKNWKIIEEQDLDD